MKRLPKTFRKHCMMVSWHWMLSSVSFPGNALVVITCSLLLFSFQGGADRSGSTAITCFITETHIIFGNCGDSRGLLARSGNVEFATDDHKPTNEVERARISVMST